MIFVGIPLAFGVGIAGGLHPVAGAGLVGAALGAMAIGLAPQSFALKLLATFLLLTVVQTALGFVKFEPVRGASIGNLVVAVMAWNWALIGYYRGQFFRNTPFNFTLTIPLLIIPLLSIFYTGVFREVEDYSVLGNTIHLKNLCVSFVGFFMVTQTLNTKKELKHLFFFILFLFSVATLLSLPGALDSKGHWRDGRTAGPMGDQINTWAAFINEISAFFFLSLFLTQGRQWLKAILLVVLAAMAISLVTTYSRMGMLGFGLGLAGSLLLSFRGNGKVPIALPSFLGVGMLVLVTAISPQVVDNVAERFSLSGFDKKEERTSTTFETRLNRFSGDRLEIWKGALRIFEENPIFGGGFNIVRHRGHEFHRKGKAQPPHSMYMGQLADGGLVLLGAWGIFFLALGRTLYRGWKHSAKVGDRLGQVLCGGALISLLCFLQNGLTSDQISTNARMCLIATLWGIAATYSLRFAPGTRKTWSTAAGPGAAPPPASERWREWRSEPARDPWRERLLKNHLRGRNQRR